MANTPQHRCKLQEAACMHTWSRRLGAAAAGPHLVRGAEHQHMRVPAGRQAGGRHGNSHSMSGRCSSKVASSRSACWQQHSCSQQLTWRSQSGLGKPPRSPPAGRQAGLQAFVNKRQHGAWDTLEEGASVWGAQGGTGWAVHNAPPLSCNLPLGKQAVHCWYRLPLQASSVLPHRNQPHI